MKNEWRNVFFQAEDGIRDHCVTGVQTCALPISPNMHNCKAKQEMDKPQTTPASVIAIQQPCKIYRGIVHDIIANYCWLTICCDVCNSVCV